MSRSISIAACALSWALFGANVALAQDPVVQQPVVQQPVVQQPVVQQPVVQKPVVQKPVVQKALPSQTLKTTAKPTIVQVQSNTVRLAKGSRALETYLKQNADASKELLRDPAVRRELDPELLKRLEAEGGQAFQDATLVSRVLQYDGVVRKVLGDERAQQAVEQELRVFHESFQGAEFALRRGDQRDAATRFAAAAQEARKLGNRPAEAEARLDGARALEALDRKLGKAENAAKILAWYDVAIEAGEAPQRSLARNNKGVALLGMGRGTEAISELERVDYEAVAPDQRPVFRYNLGRAYEKENRAPEAAATYRGIVAAEPSFRPAVDRLYGLLRESKAPEEIQAAAVLTNELVQRGEGRAALENVRGCLDEWKGESAVPAICEVLVRSYVEGRVSPAEYEKTEKAFLTRVARGAESAPTGDYLERFTQQLERAYEGELPVDPSPRLARELFPKPSQAWSAEEVTGVNMPEELSRLLKLAGDHYDGGGDPGQALARYLLSWNLDPDNTEALVYVAEMVRRNEDLALEGELRASLVNRIFEEKGAQYLKQYKTAQDWLNILRYHVLLASIFEERGEWGSPRELASVVFQLEHAIAAEKRVREAGGTIVPSPGLHYRLGLAYVASERPRLRPLAWPSFMEAARGFVRDENAADARVALEAARELGPPQDEAARKEWSEVRDAVRRMESDR